MFRRFLVVLLFVVAALQVQPVQAQPIAQGDCPPVFDLHTIDHNGEETHEHRVVGRHVDANEDQQLCVQHVTPSEAVHVHIDNLLPLR